MRLSGWLEKATHPLSAKLAAAAEALAVREGSGYGIKVNEPSKFTLAFRYLYRIVRAVSASYFNGIKSLFLS